MRRAVDQARDDPPLAVAEKSLAVTLENILDALAGGLFDLAVGIDERKAQFLREALSDAGLAGAHQPDQRDGPAQLRGRHRRFARRCVETLMPSRYTAAV